jgi:hypothetical protein
MNFAIKDGFKDETSVDSDSEIGGLLHDTHEALVLARDHGNSIPPVRVLRILAGEGSGQFSSIDNYSHDTYIHRSSVPLSVALDYVGATLDESSSKMERLQVDLFLLLMVLCLNFHLFVYHSIFIHIYNRATSKNTFDYVMTWKWKSMLFFHQGRQRRMAKVTSMPNCCI